jgi:hypothetical protein
MRDESETPPHLNSLFHPSSLIPHPCFSLRRLKLTSSVTQAKMRDNLARDGLGEFYQKKLKNLLVI